MPLLYLTQLRHKPVFAPSVEVIARVQDFIVRVSGEKYPPITGMVAVVPGHGQIFVPSEQIQEIGEAGVRLRSARLSLQRFQLRPGEVLMYRHLVDKQLVDVNGRRIVKTNDLVITRVGERYLLVGADISAQSAIRRVGLDRPVQFAANVLRAELRPTFIDWADVEHFASDAPAVQLRVPHERVAKLHPVEIAHLIDSLTTERGAELIQALDDETAADTLEELSPETQVDLISALPEERAADILEEMAPDEAADVLGDLPPEKAEDLLELMEPEESEDVKELLGFPEHSAGGIMTTEYIAIPQSDNAAQALERIGKRIPVPDVYDIFVVDDLENERLVGVTRLQDLVWPPPHTTVADFMQREFPRAHVSDDEKSVAHTIARYNLLALPVVDDDNRLRGIVTVDDAMDIILPTAWKKRLPRIFA